MQNSQRSSYTFPPPLPSPSGWPWVQEVGKAWTYHGRCEEIQEDVDLHDFEGNKVDLYERLKESEKWIQGATPEQRERRAWAEDMLRGAARVAMADGNKAAFEVRSSPNSRCRCAASNPPLFSIRGLRHLVHCCTADQVLSPNVQHPISRSECTASLRNGDAGSCSNQAQGSP
jgi:hypothetical protein